MRQLDGFVVCSIDFVPHEAVNVFTLTFYFIENVFYRLESVLSLFATRVEQSGELFQFVPVQQVDVHHVYKCSAIVKLLLRLIELQIKLLQTLVAESLTDSVNESFKVEREGRPESLECFRIAH